MWLLSTDRAELKYFIDADQARHEVFAILSHVWDKEEQTFPQTQALRDQCTITGENPRDLASEKVRRSCMLAESHGYKWIWNDTCCIDKTSSAELSEAINSMYEYYAKADVCYAFLRDVQSVRSVEVLEEPSSAFRKSRWHFRGWTLQELIAPDDVVFIAADWTLLGTKADLAALLKQVTLVPVAILKHEEDLSTVSVASRMSWATRRETTRKEDEAYCLMGIFAINMPTLYGEGRQAFRRLQEEIMKQSVDTSLFAWGAPYGPLPDLPDAAGQSWDRLHEDSKYILAPSPFYFEVLNDVSWTRPTTIGRAQGLTVGISNATHPEDLNGLNALIGMNSSSGVQDTTLPPQSSSDTQLAPKEPASGSFFRTLVGVPTFTITPHGVHAHVPIIQVEDSTIAILLGSHRNGREIGLLLGTCDYADPARPLFYTSTCEGDHRRTIFIDQLLGDKPYPTAEWRDVYLAHRQPPRSITHIPISRGLSTPFRIPQWSIDSIREAGFELRLPERLRFPWDGTIPMTVALTSDWYPETCDSIEMHFGLCGASSSNLSKLPTQNFERHWASISLVPHVTKGEQRDLPLQVTHDCDADHINTWENRMIQRTLILHNPRFVNMEQICHLTLSLTPWPLNPTVTSVANISLSASLNLLEIDFEYED